MGAHALLNLLNELRRAQRHSKHKTEQNIKDPQKKYRLGTRVTTYVIALML